MKLEADLKNEFSSDPTQGEDQQVFEEDVTITQEMKMDRLTKYKKNFQYQAEKNENEVTIIIGPGQEKPIKLSITDYSCFSYSFASRIIIEDA